MMSKAEKDMIDSFQIALEIADKNDWPMVHFALNKEIVRQYLFEKKQEEKDMEKTMMIDYRNDEGKLFRKTIDDMEFCVRRGAAWFISAGEKISVPLDNVIQVYLV